MTATRFVTVETETCCNCGVVFGLESNYQNSLRETHAWFHCPNGHRQHYTGESDQDKANRLQRQLQEQQEATRIARTEAQGERLRRERAEAKVKRARAGVCVDCKRTFQNVVRHRASVHTAR